MATKPSALLLIINPGSTTTKIAIYRGLEEVLAEDFTHDWRELAACGTVAAQEECRYWLVQQVLARCPEHHRAQIAAVIGRGGLLRPIASGVYRVSEQMLTELRAAVHGEHASNLGAILAKRCGDELGVPAYIADPVVVDELWPEARLCGMPEIERRSIFHALNHKSVARQAAANLGRDYTQVKLIVAHLGGGISVAAHVGGRVVDVNNALDGDGPFSPERAGSVPAGQLVRLVMSGQLTAAGLQRRLCGQGGVCAHLGTKDMVEVAKRVADGDTHAELVLRSMAYQIVKEIGALAAAMSGQVDVIILTGGMARLKFLTDEIIARTAFIAPAQIIPGEREMEALAENATAALRGGVALREYPPPDHDGGINIQEGDSDATD